MRLTRDDAELALAKGFWTSKMAAGSAARVMSIVGCDAAAVATVTSSGTTASLLGVTFSDDVDSLDDKFGGDDVGGDGGCEVGGGGWWNSTPARR